MNDTPEEIKKLQLQIWLSKSPAERLRQFLIDNDTLMQFWKKGPQKKGELSKNGQQEGKSEMPPEPFFQ